MKIIQSEGGPLIGFDREVVHYWSGIAGKRFVGETSPYDNDYEALCDMLKGRKNSPSNIGKFSGLFADGLLIRIPDETTVVEATGGSVYIAQVEAAEADWSFSLIRPSDFNKVEYDKKNKIHFYTKACAYMFFDAAYAAEDIGDDYIGFELEEGHYVFSNGFYRQDELAELILYKIEKLS